MARALLIAVALAGCGPRGGSDAPPRDTSWSLSTGTTPTTSLTLPTHPHTNLLVLSIDTLRRDHVGRFDPQQRDLMPFLSSLMDEGIVAEHHVTGSNWTYHAMSTALAGRYPVDEGVLPRVDPSDHGGWPAGSRFLADELRDAGFTTIMASANGWMKPQYGLGGSYDTYLGEAFDDGDAIYTMGSTALQDALDAGGVARWYLHLHFIEPHAPYIPPAEYRVGEDQLDPLLMYIDTQPAHYAAVNQWPNLTPEEQALLEAHLRVRYEGELRWLDDKLAAMWADMDARGWLDDTLVVVFSDHGEQFWERGNQSHAFHAGSEEADGLFFLWSRAYEPDVQPLRTSGVDIAPTILRHLGLEPPPEWTGVPLSEIPPGRPVFTEANARLGGIQRVTRGDRALTYLWTGQALFHHLDTDPEMRDDRYDPANPEVQELWELLRPRVRQADPLAPAQTPVPPPGLAL